MRPDVKAAYAWSLSYYLIVKEILDSVTYGETGGWNPAPLERDREKCADYELRRGVEVASVRVRNTKFADYGDFTIRAWVISGATTEIDKLREGYGDIYLFLWTDYPAAVYYVLFSISDVRDAGIWEQEWPTIKNKDGKSALHAIPYAVIEPFIIREGFWPKKNLAK